MTKGKFFACRAEEVVPGRQKIVEVGGRSVGVFEVDRAYHALLNVCPHRGAPLCEGPVCGTAEPTGRHEFVYGRKDAIVRCAWHGWEFDIRTGVSLVDPAVKARSVPVSVEDGGLYLHL
jgi:nitrite reductase/ring-hydroxylating ferredoxin subunit